jgi:Protein of unknown function (DUF1573)
MDYAFRPFICMCAIISFCCAGSPKIEFDKTTFDCGTIVDGSKEKLYASFIAKNTGNAPLRIENVRPSCHCTVVNFDTLVMPGKSSKIEAVVTITSYHSGSISKPITVTSNAINAPVKQLVIKANIQPVIDVSEQLLNLDATKPGLVHSIFLSSAKRDLKVMNVDFNRNKENGALWKEQIPLSIKYSWMPLDSIRSDGYRVFKLNLVVPAAPEELRGVLAVQTNHPDKQELIVQCIINK